MNLPTRKEFQVNEEVRVVIPEGWRGTFNEPLHLQRGRVVINYAPGYYQVFVESPGLMRNIREEWLVRESDYRAWLTTILRQVSNDPEVARHHTEALYQAIRVIEGK